MQGVRVGAFCCESMVARGRGVHPQAPLSANVFSDNLRKQSRKIKILEAYSLKITCVCIFPGRIFVTLQVYMLPSLKITVREKEVPLKKYTQKLSFRKGCDLEGEAQDTRVKALIRHSSGRIYFLVF